MTLKRIVLFTYILVCSIQCFGTIHSHEKLIESILKQPNNSTHQYNLGTYYLKHKEIGKAILHLEKARQLSPRDKDIIHNLSIAKKSVVDQLNKTYTRLNVNENFLKKITLIEWASLTLVSSLLFTWKYQRSNFNLSSNYVFLYFTLIMSCILIWKALESKNDYIIVQTNQVQLRESPSSTVGPTISIDEGIKAKVIKNHKKWIKISFSNGFSGWIEKKYSQKI